MVAVVVVVAAADQEGRCLGEEDRTSSSVVDTGDMGRIRVGLVGTRWGAWGSTGGRWLGRWRRSWRVLRGRRR